MNVHNGPGGSITGVITDLETIWLKVLDIHFSISQRDLKLFKAVLIIPDVFNRTYLRELMTLLLLKMGFSSAFLVQVKANGLKTF